MCWAVAFGSVAEFGPFPAGRLVNQYEIFSAVAGISSTESGSNILASNHQDVGKSFRSRCADVMATADFENGGIGD
jgi:hypothetical protein